MDLGLEGKVAIVTDGSKGIGKAVAQTLAKEGCRIAICAREKQALDDAAEEIRGSGGEVLSVSADLVKPDGTERFVQETVDHFKTVHILVNNVGSIGNPAGFDELTDEDWGQPSAQWSTSTSTSTSTPSPPSRISTTPDFFLPK